MAKKVKEPLATIYRHIQDYVVYGFLVATGLAIIFMFKLDIHLYFVIPLLFVISAFSMVYRRYVRIPPGFELMSLTTVVVGVTQGPMVGAIYGAMVAIAAEVISAGVDPFIIGYVFGRSLQGALAGYFASVDVVILGLVLVLIYNIIAQALYLLQGDPAARLKTFSYVITNLALNWIFFRFIAPLLVMALTFGMK